MAAAGLVPDPWQADLLACDAPSILLLTSRQNGKSSVAAALRVLDLGGWLVCARLSDGRMASANEAEGLPLIPWCQASSGVDPFVVIGQRTVPDPIFRRE